MNNKDLTLTEVALLYGYTIDDLKSNADYIHKMINQPGYWASSKGSYGNDGT